MVILAYLHQYTVARGSELRPCSRASPTSWLNEDYKTASPWCLGCLFRPETEPKLLNLEKQLRRAISYFYYLINERVVPMANPAHASSL